MTQPTYWSGSVTPTTKRCAENRAHYAHEWYNPLRIQCPGGPDEEPRPEPLDIKDILSIQQLGKGDRLFVNGAVVTIVDVKRKGRDVTVTVQPEGTEEP